MQLGEGRRFGYEGGWGLDLSATGKTGGEGKTLTDNPHPEAGCRDADAHPDPAGSMDYHPPSSRGEGKAPSLSIHSGRPAGAAERSAPRSMGALNGFVGTRNRGAGRPRAAVESR